MFRITARGGMRRSRGGNPTFPSSYLATKQLQGARSLSAGRLRDVLATASRERPTSKDPESIVTEFCTDGLGSPSPADLRTKRTRMKGGGFFFIRWLPNRPSFRAS
jgi:hypothetical protein